MTETLLAILLDPALMRYGGAKPPLFHAWMNSGLVTIYENSKRYILAVDITRITVDQAQILVVLQILQVTN